MENRTKWKKTEILILALLAVMGIAAVIKLGSILLEYMGGDSTYKLLQEYVFLPEEDSTPWTEAAGQSPKPGQNGEAAGQSSKPSQNAESASGEAAWQNGYVYYGEAPQVNFEELKTINSNLAGWIYAPGTTINYPVAQGNDNSYYLTHMFDGKKNKCGSIFMDCLNARDFSNTNSILHGHNMKNGSMFADLSKYSAPAYYETHPVMWLVTPEKTYRVEIFTGFVADNEGDVWKIEFANTEAYGEWLDNMKASSVFQSDVTPGTDDKILTLATCSYEYETARFVVMGVLREV